MEEELAKRLAIRLALLCVRHTCIEDIHAGVPVDTIAGDYSDVKVVTPSKEIPWNELQRISEAEMRDFMKEVVNKIYTVLLRLDDIEFIERMDNFTVRAACKWDEPDNLSDWFTGKWDQTKA
ncbi:MAG: hypothetical protein JSS02_21295 [Planctomycetes bacterium]|nr:hypothetical protein [Planctomycetota bacterium]